MSEFRILTGHKVNDCNDCNDCNNAINIVVMEEAGHGGASHVYELHYGIRHAEGLRIEFQDGPIREVGSNGITHEALLAILIDRLEGFQSGPYACDENAIALAHIREAQATLKARSEKRVARGVEGTHTV